jgi:hypothetical protein
MKSIKSLLLIGALTLGTALTLSAQSDRNWGDRDHRYGWRDDDYSNRRAYQDGYKDGQKAARHRGNSGKYDNKYRDSDDRRAYDLGYRRGYNAGRSGDWRDHDRDRDGDWRDDRDNNRSPHPFGDVMANRGNYPNGGDGRYGNVGNARGIGYNDGLLAGQKDRSTGHSFRPTENKGYKDADKGYSSSFNKEQYKQAYRDGFMQGYQRGYNNR